MDVYSQGSQRAHDSGFVGMEADSDDLVDGLEVYEALVNPREAQGAGGRGGAPMMMPPMMGGMGAGGAGASGGLGAGASMAGLGAAGGGLRMAGLTAAGSAPMTTTASGPTTAVPNMGAPSVGGGGRGAGSMPLAAGAAPPTADPPEVKPTEPTTDEPTQTATAGQMTVDGHSQILDPSTRDHIEVDPAEVDRVAKEWSDLSTEMADVSKAALALQASQDDFGLVRQPAGPYGEMTTGIESLASGASKEFGEIASGLSYGAQRYRDQEDQAAQTVRSAQ